MTNDFIESSKITPLFYQKICFVMNTKKGQSSGKIFENEKS